MATPKSARLHFGPYAAPRFRYGRKVDCEVRGEVTIVGLSDARIPWPLGRVHGSYSRGLIIYGTLGRAVRRESNLAVCYWWGVTPQTVTRWRKALGVEPSNEGTLTRRRELAGEPWCKKALHKAQSKAGDPERRRKISEALRGKPRPAHVMVALHQSNVGRVTSAATRRKMSATHRNRGTRPPWLNRAWSAAEDALLDKLSPAEIAKQTGRTVAAVRLRRQKLAKQRRKQRA